MIQNIKSLCVVAYLSIVPNVFSFYKIESIFRPTADTISYSTWNPNRKQRDHTVKRTYLCDALLINKTRKVSCGNESFTYDNFFNLAKIKECFIVGNGTLLFPTINNEFKFNQEQTRWYSDSFNTTEDYTNFLNEYQPILEIDEMSYQNQYSRCYISFHEEIKSSLSEVTILNTKNGVQITKDNNSVDLTKALRKYFVKKIEDLNPQDLAQKLGESYTKDNSLKSISEKILKPVINLRNYGRKTLSEEEYERLQKSTIIAVFKLFYPTKPISLSLDNLLQQYKQNNLYSLDMKNIPKLKQIKLPTESQIGGLLKDDHTGQLYFFKYDLEQDISVLMNYKSKD